MHKGGMHKGGGTVPVALPRSLGVSSSRDSLQGLRCGSDVRMTTGGQCLTLW
jgi:hypothetical protein